MLPMFAQLTRELIHWPAQPEPSLEQQYWWHPSQPGKLSNAKCVDLTTGGLTRCTWQRSHENRPAAVRALLLFPMNALVEDQMTRLRKAMDSDQVRCWFRHKAKGNRLYFGRYNSNSPVAGELRFWDELTGEWKVRISKIDDLKKQLYRIHKEEVEIDTYIRDNGSQVDDPIELKAFFPRLDGAEMYTRFDMQATPPDVLVSNFSMLSIMLMRTIDRGPFDETKKWLAGEDLPIPQREAAREDRIFHLVIDELHLYRGTSGTEVAYLIRLLLDRLGLHPTHPQFRILASSASLQSDDLASQTFIKDFFGLPDMSRVSVIQGETVPRQVSPTGMAHLPTQPFVDLADAHEKQIGEADLSVVYCETAAQLSKWSSASLPVVGDATVQLLTILANPVLYFGHRLRTACIHKGREQAVMTFRRNESIEKPAFGESLFGADIKPDILRKAVRGVLIARSLFDLETYQKQFEKTRLPRFRFHYFFRNLEGLWASTSPAEVGSIDYKDDSRKVGELYPAMRIISPQGFRVLELLRCSTCGTTLLGGSRMVYADEKNNPKYELLPLSPDIEGVPERTPGKLLESRTYAEYGIFWPGIKDDLFEEETLHGNEWWRQTTVNGLEQTNYRSFWKPASLNRLSGGLELSHEQADQNSEEWTKGYLM